MSILVGTGSWTDKSLIACGRFYPQEVAGNAEARLRYYASQFPMVEVDSSYYAMPSPTVALQWAERTPPEFRFNVKAFRLFTGHQTSPSVLHKDIQLALGPTRPMLYYKDVPQEIRTELWRRFIDALAPLKQAGKLVAVHFQFAPWILRNPAGHEHVRHCAEVMAGHTLAVEFRNKTWFAPEHMAATLAFERKLGVCHVVVDGPQGFSNSVPAIWEVTNPELAVLRLHGRNAETWNQKALTASSDRFNYNYPDAQLAELVPKIRELSTLAKAVHVIFNNNNEDQGQRNAGTIRAMLAGVVSGGRAA